MKKNRTKDHILAFLFMLPAFVLLAVFVIYPIVSTVVISFHTWKGIPGVAMKFVGFENYLKVLKSDVFWNALLNSVYFIIGAFLVLMPISFGLAMIITSKMRGTGLMKTMYYLPVMLGTTTVALMWRAILNPNYGIVAGLMTSLGQGDSVIDWLNTAPTNVWITVLINEWKNAGYNMLIFAAGIAAIPKTVNESAIMDGCTTWQQIRYFTLPLTKNSFKVFSILAITGCLKVFDIIWAMTGGGPNNASSTPGILVYDFAYTFRQYGRSSATAIILFVLAIVTSMICNRVFRQEDI